LRHSDWHEWNIHWYVYVLLTCVWVFVEFH
jgi:hypothetical protein